MMFPTLPRASAIRARHILTAVTLVALCAAPVLQAQNRDRDQQSNDAFSWSGVVPSGNRIMIRNINGGVEVGRSTSGRVEVTAKKKWRRGDPDHVRIEQRNVGEDVVVCALWGENARCDERGSLSGDKNRNNRNNDVSVQFLVKVPDGVRVDISTVNGALDVNNVTADIRAVTVNGAVNARSAGGTIRAETVNGSIHVAMGSLRSANDLEYETVNGSITIELPANFGAQVELGTVNGRVTTDFPITISGTVSPKRLRGTVGDGSTRLRASTINGSITLRKGN